MKHSESNHVSPRILALVMSIAVAVVIPACGDGAPNRASSSEALEGKEKVGEHPLEAENEEGEKVVRLTDEQIEKSGIGIAQAGPVNLREALPLYGTIAPNAERVLDVAARFPGVIRSVKKRVGDAVRAGETLATIESNESLQTYALVAPLDGVVIQRNANEGAQSGDAPLFTVADLSTVWVEISLFPRDVAKVRIGQTVRVKSADTGLTAEGKVVYVAPFGSSSNQTLSARVQLPNPERKWPPGLSVTADVILSNASIPLGIRSEALQTMENRSVVFVQSDEGFEPRPVETGRSDGEVTEVLSGLIAGESYATKNSFILKAELGKGEAGDDD